MFLRDRDNLNCFPLMLGCQTGASFECGMAMRPGPKATRCYNSGYSNNNSKGGKRSSFQGLGAGRAQCWAAP